MYNFPCKLFEMYTMRMSELGMEHPPTARSWCILLTGKGQGQVNFLPILGKLVHPAILSLASGHDACDPQWAKDTFPRP
jgi:hypothetical protein